MKVAAFLALFFALPFGTEAAVVVNEIAWMGSAASANHEWIEIANDGDTPVDLSGWTLAAADGSPSIALSGIIAPGGYVLLERTSDESVPGIAADLIYTGALSNAGETLILRDAAGAVLDTVVGGENWANTGGDNTTKDTAQRSAAGWITAPGTPRAANASGASTGDGSGGDGEVLGASTASADSRDGAGGSGAASGGASVPSPFPRATIAVSAGEDQRVFAGFPVVFEGEARGLYDESLPPSATYQWNFGDGATAYGKTATHTYLFPGEYVATLEVFWGGKRERDRVTVSVTTADIAIAKVIPGADGYIEITNSSSREIAAGGWRLVEGGVVFVVPAHTFIPGGKTLLLPNRNSGLRGMDAVALENGEGLLLARREPVGAPLPSPQLKKSAVGQSAAATDAPPLLPAGTSSENASAPVPRTLWERAEGETAASTFAGAGLFSWPLFAVILALAVLVLFLLRRSAFEASGADQYAIIEEIIEGEEGERRGKNG